MLREIPKNVIITINSVSLPFSKPDRCIIIGTDAVLISGLAILNAHSGNTIKALVLDLISLIVAARFRKHLGLQSAIYLAHFNCE